MHSCIFEGWVQHRRHQPVRHAFSYPLYMLYLDLSELQTVFKNRWLWSTRSPAAMWLRRRDHLYSQHPDEPLRESVEQVIRQGDQQPPGGPIRMLTSLRCLGFVMNPVTFFYCFDNQDQLQTVVAEVQNTPWGQRHCYVLDPHNQRAATPKVFHVSPFMPMQLRYRWNVTQPGDDLHVRIENLVEDSTSGPEDGAAMFDATLHLQRSEINTASLNRIFWRRPLMTWRVAAGIYWQALKLWRKAAPVYQHPGGAPPHRMPAPVQPDAQTMVTHGNSTQ